MSDNELMDREEQKSPVSFIEQFIIDDLKDGKNNGRIHTRFPPEPNGYLHIGHAKAICLDFGMAKKYGGKCNLRFDDTNPVKEDVEYIDSIKEDIHWLGFDWEDREFYASDYFGKLYEKPTIGDPDRTVEYEDIPRANRILYGTAVLGMAVFTVLGFLIRLA